MFVWGGMAVGRFLGAFVMRAIAPEKVLAVFAIGAFVVMMIASLAHGPTAMYGLMGVGFFHSIMFPTIFALAIRGLGPLTEEGSGWLIWAIAGGALVIVQGKLADQFGIQHSFLLTAACELFVLYYALWGARPTEAIASEQVSVESA
jgi:FHS family L-fucose permease-like MFS transporter